MRASNPCPSFTGFSFIALTTVILALGNTTVGKANTQLAYDSNGNQSARQAAVAAAPVILGPSPPRQLAATGGMVGFSVNASSSLAVSYQWYFNGVAITGATGDSLVLTGVSPASEGDYTVIVTNSSGSATSGAYKLLIDNNGNGLPDSWELAWFGPWTQQPAHADYDADGLYDLDEFLNNTNPIVKDPFVWIAASGDFNTPANWGRYRAPKAGDVAYINSGTFTLPTNTAVAVNTVTINVPFTIPPGTDYALNISGQWTFNGPFTLAGGGYFQVWGGGGATVTGATELNRTKLYVKANSRLTFSNLPVYTFLPGADVQWNAYDPGSELIFSNLALINANATSPSYLDIGAYGGGKVSLPALASITSPDNGNATPNRRVQFKAMGNNALLSAPLLATFQDNDGNPDCLLEASGSGTLSLPLLTAPKGVNMDLNAQSNPQQFTSLVNTRFFTINSGTVVMSDIISVNSFQSIVAQGGAKVAFPGVAAYHMPENLNSIWKAAGVGSELTFPALGSITGNATPISYLEIRADDGGKISLPALTTITKPNDGDFSPYGGVRLIAGDNNSVFSAPLLASFQDHDNYPNSLLGTSGSGVLSTPQLTSPKGVSIDLNAQSTLQQFTAITNAKFFSINSGAVVMSNLTSLNGCRSIYIRYGAKATFPNLTSCNLPAGTDVSWTAEGAGSELIFTALNLINRGAELNHKLFIEARSGGKVKLSALGNYTLPAGLSMEWRAIWPNSELIIANMSSITGSATPGRYLDIYAEWGGKVYLPILATITKPDDGDAYANSGVRFYANYGNSVISAPMLASFQDNDSHPASLLSAAYTGMINVAKLSQSNILGVTLSGVTLGPGFTTFLTWQQAYWSGGANDPNAALTADPLRDGVVNGMKYALGMAPTTSYKAGLPNAAMKGANVDFMFYRASSDVTYEVQQSTDLTNWTTVAVNPGTTGTLVTVPVPKGVNTGLFLRLKVTF